MISQILAAFSTELLKLKRTLALALVLIAPALVVFFASMILMQRMYTWVGKNVWEMLSGNIVFMWCSLMMPLLIALFTSLTAQLEHDEKNWKALFVMPVSRSAIVIGKLLINIFLSALASLALAFYHIVAGYIVIAIYGDFQIVQVIPLADIFEANSIIFLTSMIILMIHSWLSMFSKSLVLNFAPSFGLVILGAMIASEPLARFFPWSLTTLTVFADQGEMNFRDMVDPSSYVLTNIVGALIVSLIIAVGCVWHISRRDVI
jgi:hypothetical protein